MAAPQRLSSFIGGTFARGGTPFTVLDKYLQTEIAEVEASTAAHVDAAVALAERAARTDVPAPARRFDILSSASRLLDGRKAEFADLLIAETGFTAADATMEVERAVLTLSLCADEARRIAGEMVPMASSAGQENRLAFTIRTPIGVVCAITPFNSPLNVVLHKIGPALAAGNAVVLKPSGYTPIMAVRLAELLVEAGLPASLISVLHDHDGSAASALLADQRIGFYTFTGSTRVGRLIQREAGLRRTQLELGSIASTIVCADADLERALPKVANAAFRKAGQVCTSVQRLYVQADIFDEALSRLVRLATEMKTGDPRDPATRVGPLISLAAAERVERIVEEAVTAGADALCGAARSGPTYAPTVLTGTKAGARALDEEIFGPVLSVVPFATLDEAIDGANATPFGLSVGLFTNDLKAILPTVSRLRFGSVHINESSSARADAMPFGGVKDSGFGREGPRYAVREYSEERLVTLTP